MLNVKYEKRHIVDFIVQIAVYFEERIFNIMSIV